MILAMDAFTISYFERTKNNVAVILCRHVYGFDALLNSEVLVANHIAYEFGVQVGMKAKEALMLCENTKEKEG